MKGSFKKGKAYIFYELPEEGLKLEEYLNAKNKLEKLWDSFKFVMESESVVNSEEITNRSKEIETKIHNINKILKDLQKNSKYKDYLKKLQIRQNLMIYISDLEQNRGIDVDLIMEGDFEEQIHPQLDVLHKNKRFWRNLGKYYNSHFERGINWEIKVNQIKRDIETEENALKQIKETSQER